MCNTPVEVQFTSAGCLNYPCRTPLEGLDEILTVSRLGLPAELRRSLACTNIIENMMGTVRRVTRNVKRWSSSSVALRWTAAAMQEAKKGFRRLKAFKQLPALRAALAAHYEMEQSCASGKKSSRRRRHPYVGQPDPLE
jgi:hypothetical protein